jgi:hypothetical protein
MPQTSLPTPNANVNLLANLHCPLLPSYSVPGDCPRRFPPCLRASSALIYCTDNDWLSFGWWVRGRMSVGGLQPGAALVVARLAIVTLQPRSTSPAVAGCRLVGYSVVSRRPLHSRDVAGVSQRVCVGLGPVLASRAPSLSAATAADWRGRGRVPIAGWSYDGVGPDRGLQGVCVRNGPGEARTILLLHIISVWPSKQPLIVRTFLKVS